MPNENEVHVYEIQLPAEDGHPPRVMEVEADEIIAREEEGGLNIRLWLKGVKVAQAYPAVGWRIRPTA